MRNPKMKTQPVIISPKYTATTPAESFGDISRGDLTWHTLLSKPKTPSDSMCAGVAVCPVGTGHLCRHRHTQSEIYYILDGSGDVTIDGIVYPVSKDTTVFIPGNAEHGIVNTGVIPLRWLYVFPTGSFQDVVYRFSGEGMVKANL
ncbi:RmlC-like cupin domain-containing protein [Bisporella sp. PMI_857]|nr:RmlC-like cupin domain-containing protein [Bisporella sp. PMI_857]